MRDSTSSAGPERWVRLAGEDGDTSIDGYELFSARRALTLLKTNLGRGRLLELLHEEIEAGTTFLRENVERSGGRVLFGTTTLRAHGTSAAQFTAWLSRAFAHDEVMIAGHPEHYSIHAEPGRPVNVVETLGEHVCSFFMLPYDDAGAPAPEDGATSRRRSRMALEDGTVVGTITNAFHDEDDGFTVHLSVTLPATCGQDAIDHHLEHFAVEYHSWILRAAAELAAGSR